MLKAIRTMLIVACAVMATVSLVAVPQADAKSWRGNGNWNGGGNWHGGGGGSWHGGGPWHGGYRGGGCWNCGNWWGPAIGLGTGLIIGSMLAQPYYGYAPRYYAPRYSSRVAYCKARFRSYNVATRTYLGYDGRRHYC